MTEWLRHDERVIDFMERYKTRVGRPDLLCRVYACGFCLSHWVGGICLVCALMPVLWLLPAFFAVVRLANTFNDITSKFNKSPHKTFKG